MNTERITHVRRWSWWPSARLLVWLLVPLAGVAVLLQLFTVTELSLRDLSKRHFSVVGVRWTLLGWQVSEPVIERTGLSDWIASAFTEAEKGEIAVPEFVLVRITSHWEMGRGYDMDMFGVFTRDLYAISNFHPESHYPGFRSGDEFWTNWSQSHPDEAREFWGDVLRALRQGHPDHASILVRHKRTELLK